MDETAKARQVWDRAAPTYDRQIAFLEKHWFTGGREWLGARATGRVLDVGVGTGRNLPHYPPGTTVTGIDLSAEMIAVARQRAGSSVDLRVGDAEHLPFPDASFDTVVCTLGLCTIPDDRKAASEAHRVLRPGGRLLLMEHVRSPSLPVRSIERLLDPLSVRFQADHLLRDPLDYLAAEGFDVERVERSKWGIVERVVARKPPDA
jgi:ubiquinone/menaquinone biosynthesis C-methylase UbiE